MGIFRKSKGRKFSEQFIDPNCLTCRGYGRMQGASNSMVTCRCVTNNQATWFKAKQEQREQVAKDQRLENYAERFAGILADSDQRAEQAAARRSPDANAMRIYIMDLRHKVTAEVEQQMKAGQISLCCLSNPCFCTINYWGGQRYPDPPTDEAAYAQWKYWCEWIQQQQGARVTALPR